MYIGRMEQMEFRLDQIIYSIFVYHFKLVFESGYGVWINIKSIEWQKQLFQQNICWTLSMFEFRSKCKRTLSFLVSTMLWRFVLLLISTMDVFELNWIGKEGMLSSRIDGLDKWGIWLLESNSIERYNKFDIRTACLCIYW